MERDKDEMRMPFGAHKGEWLHNLPSNYLFYLAVNCDWNDTVQNAADEEWQYRDKYNCHIDD